MKTTIKIFNWIIMSFIISSLGFALYLLLKKTGSHLAVTIFLVIYVLTSITGIIIFSQRRQNTAKLSWLIVIILVPIAGAIVYAIFGRRYKGRLLNLDYLKKYKKTYHSQAVGTTKDISSLLKEQSRLSNRPVLNANIKLYSSGMESFKALFKDLKKAQKFINLNYYIVKQGELWEELKHILYKKVEEGVEVKLLIDDFGKWSLPWYELKKIRKKGIQISIFNKVRFPFISSQDGFRSHRKYTIIDGKTVYTGGVNIADEYVGYSVKYGLWEDAVVRIQGQGVRSYSLLFINDWQLSCKQELSITKFAPFPKENGNSQTILVDDSPELDFPLIQSSLIKWILSSKVSIDITTPYLVPTPELFNALRTAALTGVKVRIFIPGFPDKRYVYQATLENSIQLLKFGVEIRVINEKFLHTKAAIFDSKTAYLGTVNLDYRSMFSQLENITLFEGVAVKQMEKLFKKYQDDSTKLSINIKKFRPRSKIKSTILKLFAPIM